jgi:hypothetical protein
MVGFDGTMNVPVVGTMGSWCVYIIGIFMQTVYILGPKSSFGTSKQHPHYWMNAMIASRRSGALMSWDDPYRPGTTQSREVLPSDPKMWMRFYMSYLINGFGFHALIHALPIEIAGQSTLTNIVVRALGMMFLIDLDESPSTVLTIQEGPDGRYQDGYTVMSSGSSSTELMNKVHEHSAILPTSYDPTLVSVCQRIAALEAQFAAVEARQWNGIPQNGPLAKQQACFMTPSYEMHGTKAEYHESLDDMTPSMSLQRSNGDSSVQTPRRDSSLDKHDASVAQWSGQLKIV